MDLCDSPEELSVYPTCFAKQMRASEFIAQLLLLIEEGPKSYSQDDLDAAFSSRAPEWEKMEDTLASIERRSEDR